MEIEKLEAYPILLGIGRVKKNFQNVYLSRRDNGMLAISVGIDEEQRLEMNVAL